MIFVTFIERQISYCTEAEFLPMSFRGKKIKRGPEKARKC
jgi:hypothetical protein